jgi:uncharacterized membrane protein YecN with MAPEG domain
MTTPTVTALYAGLLALVYLVLCGWVSAGRLRGNILHGDGGDRSFAKRIRAHANFAEYVPMILVMAALLEAGGTTAAAMHALLAPLLVARILHPFGMLARPASLGQYALRGLPAAATFAILGVAGVMLVSRAL